MDRLDGPADRGENAPRGLLDRSWVVWATVLAVIAASLYVNSHRLLWWDETRTLDRTTGTFNQMLDGVFFQSDKPPVYFLLVFVWRKISANVEFVRLISTASIVVMLVLLDRIGHTLFGTKGWRSTAVLAAAVPTVLWASVEARPYALPMALLTASTLYWVRLWVQQSRRPTADLVWYVVFSGLAVLSFYYAAFVVAGQFAAAMLTRRWKTWFAAAGGLVLMVGMWVPLILVQTMGYTRVPMPEASLAEIVASAPVLALFKWAPMWNRPAVPLAVLVLVAAVVIGSGLFARRRWAVSDTQVALFALGPTALLVGLRYLNHFRVEDRHWVVLVPGLILLFANLVERIKRPAGDVALAALLTIVVMSGVSFVRNDRGIIDYRGAAEHIAQSSAPDAPVFVYYHLDRPFQYYYRGKGRVFWITPLRGPASAVLLHEGLRRSIATQLHRNRPGDDFWGFQVIQQEKVEHGVAAALGQRLEVREVREFRGARVVRMALTEPIRPLVGDTLIPARGPAP